MAHKMFILQEIHKLHSSKSFTEDTQTLDTDWGATTDAGDNDGKVLTADASGIQFPAGITIYGMWDYVELHEGTCICYVAPRPDYINRA